jgi:glycosyltransferase involved in cell wall biosynthesis
MTPWVSVVIPSYNRVDYLRQAIDSVFSQTFRDWELIVADDGSTSETLRYLDELEKTHRAKVLRLRHCGKPSAVRNAAVRAAGGVYVAFLDSDDTWLPTKLEMQVALHQSCPGHLWSYVAMERIQENGTLMHGQPKYPTPEGAIFEQLLDLRADVSMSSVMAERTLVEQVGYFDEEQPFFEDYDLFLRLSLRSEVGVVKQPLVRMRSHSEHYSANRIGMREGQARMLTKMQPFAEQLGVGAVVRRELNRNNTDLIRAYASDRHWREALRLLWRTRLNGWHDGRWWRAGASTIKSLASALVRGANSGRVARLHET